MGKKLPLKFNEHYLKYGEQIRQRLNDFSNVKQKDYFYELCFCLLTPQSKAENALEVIEKLKHKNFFEKPFNPVKILSDKKHYIRFHNTKAKRLLIVRKSFPDLLVMINCKIKNIEKRNIIAEMVNGFGLKESSHFLRNIGYRNLAILDRHILSCLAECKVFKRIPKINNKLKYLKIENKFLKFADEVNIPVDELDLLFWSIRAGEILK